jgi:hypothetical protein
LFLGPCGFYDLWLGGRLFLLWAYQPLSPFSTPNSLFVVALVPCSWLCFPRAMDYIELKETRKALKQHVESLERHDHLIEAMQGKLGEQGSISSPLVEVIMGILLT